MTSLNYEDKKLLVQFVSQRTDTCVSATGAKAFETLKRNGARRGGGTKR
jgi:hypothetical protein